MGLTKELMSKNGSTGKIKVSICFVSLLSISVTICVNFNDKKEEKKTMNSLKVKFSLKNAQQNINFKVRR